MAENTSDRLTEVSYGGLSAYSAWSVRTKTRRRSETPTARAIASRLTTSPSYQGRYPVADSSGSPPVQPSALTLASPFATPASIELPQPGHDGSTTLPDVPMDVVPEDRVVSGLRDVAVDRSANAHQTLSLSTSFFTDGESGKHPSPTV